MKTSEARALRVLARAGDLIAGTLDPRAMFGALAQLAVDELADAAAVVIRESDGAYRTVVVAQRESATAPLGFQSFDAWSEAECDASVSCDSPAEDAGHGDVPTVAPVGSTNAVAVALPARGRVLGALELWRRDPKQSFDEADLLLAQELGRRAGVALDHLRLYRAERCARQLAEAGAERARRLERLAAVLANALTAEEVGSATLGECVAVFGATSALIALTDESSGELRIVHQLGDSALLFGLSRESGEVGLPLIEAARHARLVLIDAAAQHLELGAGVAELGQTSACAAVPLQREGGSVGAIALSFARPRCFRKEDAELMLAIGRQAAQAFERARLLDAERLARDAVRAAFERAKAAERRKDEFLAMLGHELRNPLAPIATALELMRVRADRTTERERAVIERQVRHMTRLVDDLLDVSRITRGKIALHRTPVEIDEVLRMSVDLASPLLEECRHQLVLEVPKTGLVVDADVVRLSQVIANLLTNAARYTQPGGRITVSASRQAGEIVVRVRDTGVGIDPELLPTLFEVFTQGPRSIDRSAGGLGLGLPIAKHLAELHGGGIEASSAGLGQGSEFVVRLPALMRPSEPPSVPPRSGHDIRRRRRILIVDDNVDNVAMLTEALSAAGHDVKMAYDGPGALDVAREFRPEVALLDIGLPVMDGYELASRLENELTQSPLLIAVTGYGQEQDRERARQAGFWAHLVKPVELSAVLRAVEGELPSPSSACASSARLSPSSR